MILIFIVILLLSVIFTLLSMKDLAVPKEVRQMILAKKIKGTIIFFKNKVHHYSSSSSESSV